MQSSEGAMMEEQRVRVELRGGPANGESVEVPAGDQVIYWQEMAAGVVQYVDAILGFPALVGEFPKVHTYERPHSDSKFAFWVNPARTRTQVELQADEIKTLKEHCGRLEESLRQATDDRNRLVIAENSVEAALPASFNPTRAPWRRVELLVKAWNVQKDTIATYQSEQTARDKTIRRLENAIKDAEKALKGRS